MITQYPLSGVNNPLITETNQNSRIEQGATFIHNGIHLALAAAGTLNHTLITGAKEVHLKLFNITASASPITVNLTESPTITANGTAGSVVNKNRNSAITNTSTVREGDTVTAVGAHLEGDFTTGNKQTGGSQSGIDDEWILKPNTNYLVPIINNSTGNADINFHLEWYEAQ